MLKVLLFSVSIGAGHDLAAKSFGQCIQNKYPDAEIQLIDTFKFINPVLDKVVSGTYMEALKFTPKVWGYLYDQAEHENKLQDFGQIFNKLLSSKLKNLVLDFKPDLLVCSHAFPCGILSLLKEKENLNIPLISLITDYTIHPFWINKHVDKYVLPSEYLTSELTKKNIPEEKIWSTGLPIRDMFSSTWNKLQVRQELGLEDKTTILIMGGGLGLGSIESIVHHLDQEHGDWQLIVITGKNTKLKNKLEKYKAVKNLVILGFVDNMAKIMAASDLIITKPGGMTTAEVLAMKLPMVIVSPIPGQEYRNTNFLLNHGVALMVNEVDMLSSVLNQVLNNELRLQQMQIMAHHLGKPLAAQSLLEKLENTYLL